MVSRVVTMVVTVIVLASVVMSNIVVAAYVDGAGNAVAHPVYRPCPISGSTFNSIVAALLILLLILMLLNGIMLWRYRKAIIAVR